MSRLLLRPRAVRDLDQIWTYTSERWGKAQAERYLRAIRAECSALASGAHTGTDASDIAPPTARPAPAATSCSSA